MTRFDPGSPDPDSPDSSAHDDDAVWLDLVARLEGTGSGPAGGAEAGSPAARTFRDFDPLGLAAPAPVEPPAGGRAAALRGVDDAATGQGPTGPGATGPGATAPGATGPRDYEPEDDDGAFVPEEPPSLAGSDPLTMLAWLGAVGGPIALLLSAIFWRSAPLLAVVGMVVAFAASVVFLIMKLPQEKDENDDGARV